MDWDAILYGQSNSLHTGEDADTSKVRSAVLGKTHGSLYPAEDTQRTFQALNM